MEFRKNGKYITNLFFSNAKNLRWHNLTTLYLPSHVIYLCITPVSSLHGSVRAVWLNPFPFLSSSSLGSMKYSIASLNIVYFPIHCYAFVGTAFNLLYNFLSDHNFYVSDHRYSSLQVLEKC
jgi:hypothetical protein